MSLPLISIVVPTLNQASFIEQTLASIVGQNWPRTEIIVIDGGSTDGTREVVQKYPVTHFISELDRGQADAINKGMRLAKGEILAWLNSDDYYLPLAFARVAEALKDTGRPQLVYGGCLLLFEQEQTARVDAAQPFDREKLTRGDTIHQAATFWTRALWEATGELTPEHHFILDWEWWLRASEHGELRPIEPLLAVYRFHGAHKSGSANPRRVQEILGLVERHATREWQEIFHAVAERLPGLIASWERFAKNGGYRWHKLRHLDLYLRYGEKVNAAFWQLHV